MWKLKFIQKGAYCELSAIVKGEKCETLEFIDELKKTDKSNFITLQRLLEYIVDNGPPPNITQFKRVRKNLYEIKSKNVRLFCFFSKDQNRLLISTHGWKKSRKKVQDLQIKRAEEIRDEYLEQND